MKKWKSVIVFDVLMVLLIILLYSPVQLALNPLDPNFFKAAFSVIAGVFIAYELIKVNGRAILTARAAKQISEGSEDIHVDDIKRMLSEYTKTSVIGTYAKHAITELESAEVRRTNLYETIASKFTEGSLTYSKFIEVVDAATNAIAHNSAILARRIQAFDVEDYNRNARDTITGMFKRSTVPEEIRRQKREVYEMSLNDMRGIVAANERLLVELERFAVELRTLESTENAVMNNQLLEEVNTLVEETKYYR